MIRLFWKIKDWWRGFPLLGGQRSPKWSSFRKDFEIIRPKKCAICGNEKCDLHHKKSFATHPELELSMDNLCWLCDGWGTLQHHRGVGHLGSFLSLNENLDGTNGDIAIWKKKFDTRPKWDGKEWIYINYGK
jgi:hypothetical protein